MFGRYGADWRRPKPGHVARHWTAEGQRVAAMTGAKLERATGTSDSRRFL